MAAKININGADFTGRSINITNGKIVIDGKSISIEDQKIINIKIDGDVDVLSVDVCESLTVDGNVKMVKTMSGDIEINGEVSGSVESTSGDIDVTGDIHGDVKTVSGDVDCDNIDGDVDTVSGNIKTKSRN